MKTIKHTLIQRVKDQGIRCCVECKSSDLEYFDRVYITGELFSFPYCRHCGLVQWHMVSNFHLTLEKLYDVYIQLADEMGMSSEQTLTGLEYIKKRKGDEGYSDDVVILKEVFEIIGGIEADNNLL